MTPSEAKHTREQLAKFDALTNQKDKCLGLIKAIDSSNKGPFTGDYRESRSVAQLDIQFSKTLGGAAPVSVSLYNVDVSAYKLGEFLKSQLQENLKLINEEITML